MRCADDDEGSSRATPTDAIERCTIDAGAEGKLELRDVSELLEGF
jgi:hypothetical protein